MESITLTYYGYLHNLITKTLQCSFFNVRVAQDPKIHLQENEYLGESAK